MNVICTYVSHYTVNFNTILYRNLTLSNISNHNLTNIIYRNANAVYHNLIACQLHVSEKSTVLVILRCTISWFQWEKCIMIPLSASWRATTRTRALILWWSLKKTDGQNDEGRSSFISHNYHCHPGLFFRWKWNILSPWH